MKIIYIISFIIISFSTNSCSALTEEAMEKRKKIEYAVEQGILSIYDIPFKTYVSLDMWDQIDDILETSHKDREKYRLPGMYYSRPYIINNEVWVFENTDARGREIYIFQTDRLKLLRTLKNDAFARYEGGIRTFSMNKIISGGADQDVDTVVIWNTETDEVKSVKLSEGHYVGSIAVKDGRMYIGSCGGKINIWNIEDVSYHGTCSASGQDTKNWEVFNQQPCITAVTFHEGRIFGAGEKQISIWDMDSGTLVKTYDKIFTNSIVYFYKDHLIEYKDNKIAVRNLSDGKIQNGAKTAKPINDLIVTDEKILPDFTGTLLITSQRHNKGLAFYDFKTMNLLKETSLKGETLNVHQNKIFATDDRFLYKYDMHYQQQEKYKAFLKTIQPQELDMTEDTYLQLLKRSQDYPDVIKTNELSRAFLEQNKLSLYHAFKYGKIGDRVIYIDKENKNEGLHEDIYGYKLIYEMKNLSDTGYYMTLMFKWQGEYGKNKEKSDIRAASHSETFFIPPKDGKIKGMFTVGEKEPLKLFIYPVKIEKTPEGYYEELTKALSREHNDLELIDKYLNDKRVEKWHPELEKRKNEITGKEQEGFWLFNLVK